MALKDLVIPSIPVPVPGGEDLVVRGLGLDSIIYLVRVQGSPLQEAFQRAMAGKFATESVAAMAVDLLDHSPEVVAHIIACAVGEPDQWEKVRGLPAPVQLELLKAAGELTFAVEGGPKKVLETVIEIMGSVSKTLEFPTT